MTGLDREIARWWARYDAAGGGSVDWPRDALLARDLPLGAAGKTVSPNGWCHILRAADGWIAINLARDDDRAAVPAWLEADVAADALVGVEAVTRTRSTRHWCERAELLQLPLGVARETPASLPVLHHPRSRAERAPGPLRVVDLSALWAGPLCGALLAAAGAEVMRVEDPARRDPTHLMTPRHACRLNGSKRVVVVPVRRDRLADLIAKADVLITAARPAALARLGFAPSDLLRDHPRLLWIAITAHGWHGRGATRVGFGDDCTIAGGLFDVGDGPRFAGDALADPLTGLVAATVALETLAANRSGLLDCALAPTAALFARAIGR